MTKAQEIRRNEATASCTRWSVAFNLVFVLNLVTTPFMAYLAEPRPGGVISHELPTWTSFNEFVNVTSAYLQELYNNKTMDSNAVSRRDIASNTFVMRFGLTLQFEIPQDDVFDYYIKMP
ncbi:hypothetical protein LEN26_017720, partial [Aphanomyces euteiches]